MVDEKSPSTPADYEVLLTYGTDVTRPNALQTARVPWSKLEGFIAHHVNVVEQIAPEVSTIEHWGSLSKRQRSLIKTQGTYVTAGSMQGTRRAREEVTESTWIILDLDHGNRTQADIELMFSGMAVAYWATVSSTPEDRRWRIMIPLARPVAPDEYEMRVRAFCDALGVVVDDCSKILCQPQLLPFVFGDYAPSLYQTFNKRLDLRDYGPKNTMTLPDTGEVIDMDTGEVLPVGGSRAPANKPDSFERYTQSHKPTVGVSPEQIRYELHNWSPSVGYPIWFKVGAAIHHETGGSDEGWEIFRDWSARSPEKFDEQAAYKQWESYRKHPPANPITFASLTYKGQLFSAQSSELRQRLQTQIQQTADYNELGTRVCRAVAKESGLTEMDREILVKEISQRSKELTKKAGSSRGVALELPKIRRLCSPTRGAPTAQVRAPDGADIIGEGWVYDQSLDNFVHLRTGRRCSTQGFNAEFDRVILRLELARSATDFALRGPKPVPIVASSMYLPGMIGTKDYPEVVEYNGVFVRNQWSKDSAPKRVYPEYWTFKERRAVAKLFKLLRFMFKSKRERRLIMAWFAHVAQRPTERINWMLLIQGPPGIGKTMLGDIMRAVLGSENVGVVDPRGLESHFTGWAAGHQLKIIEELRNPGERGMGYSTVNSIKPMITNNVITVRHMHRDYVMIPNFANWLGLTNYQNALPIEPNDRRVCVIFCHPQTDAQVRKFIEENPDLYKTIYEELIEGMPEVLAGLLHAVRPKAICPEFDAKGHAPRTPARDQMVDYTKPDLEVAVEEILDEGGYGINPAQYVISTTHLNDALARKGLGKLNTKRLAGVLAQYGYVRWQGGSQGKFMWGGVRTKVWVKPDYENCGAHQIQFALESSKRLSDTDAMQDFSDKPQAPDTGGTYDEQ